MEEIRGSIYEIIFHNEENGYTVAAFETESDFITISGNMASPKQGVTYILRGQIKVHPKYGEQFSFSDAEEVLPENSEEILNFLSSGVIKGVGPKIALQLVNSFGDKTLDVIENSPRELVKLPGIGAKTAEKISASFAKHREFAEVSLFFQKYGIASSQAMRLYKAYGKAAVELIKENPYRLIEEVSGIGFRKADSIAEKLGIDKASTFRINSGIKYGLSVYVNDGSTYVPQEELCERVAELLEVSRDAVNDEIVQLAFSLDIKVEKIDGVNVVYLYNYYEAEQDICKNIANLSRANIKALSIDVDSSINMTETETGVHLSEKQNNAVKKSLLSGISVITGGPGTGKTTIINTLINIFEESGLKVSLAAPTGRAAKRMTQATGHPASTIHRLLEYVHDDSRNAMIFGKNTESPLDTDVLIVDEASMIDLLLMQALTDAIKPGTRFIMVGDADQLPSVGAGNVLCDIIQSGMIDCSKLTEIFRQAEESMIVVNAHRINQGEYPESNGKDTDFFFMERRSEEKIQQLIVELASTRLPSYYEGTDATRDIQVLTPVHKGIVGTIALNEALQNAFNPAQKGKNEKKFGKQTFRVGDKVMQRKNNYELTWKRLGEDETHSGVFNGDLGKIIAIDNEYGIITVLFDEEKYCEYDFAMLDELELAYAVTVHKSQGSEFPIVIMPISWFPPMLATRNLLYTGITRGKKVVVLVGVEERLRAMIDNERIKLRYSGLKYRIENMFTFVEE